MFGSKEHICSARGKLIGVKDVLENVDVGALTFPCASSGEPSSYASAIHSSRFLPPP